MATHAKTSIRRSWLQVESWLATNAPGLLHTLLPPATSAQLAAVEAHLSCSLPDDYRALLECHNGQPRNGPALFENWVLLDCETAIRESAVWRRLRHSGDLSLEVTPAPGVRGDAWNDRWLPITYNGAGDHHCLDLDPAPGGTHGQVITYFHDDAELACIAPSIDVWFHRFARELLSGAYEHRPPSGLVRRRPPQR